VDAVADAGAEPDADTDEEARSVGSGPVSASSWALLIVKDVAVGLADRSDEKVWFSLVAFRDRSALSPLLQQMLNCL